MEKKEPQEIILPYLVQRMKFRKEPSTRHTGVDAIISFDYMGSAEFEFGALGNTLKSARGQEQSEPLEITFRGHSAWFVGPEEKFEVANAWFRDQISDQRARMKERSYIKESYGIEESKSQKFDGWWTIVSFNRLPTEKPWAIFRTKEGAQKWREAITEKR